jgi:hypothetical protein
VIKVSEDLLARQGHKDLKANVDLKERLARRAKKVQMVL